MLVSLRTPVSGSAAAPPVPRARGPAWLLLVVLLAPLAAAAQAASLAGLAQAVNSAAARRGGPPSVQAGGTSFFTATDARHGRELWQSDGTRAGTRLVRDIHPGPGDANPSELTLFDGWLFFTANDGVHGAELWQSDGTPGGTRLVVDINPSVADANIRHLTVVGDSLFFSANDGTHGNELWVYHGGQARLVKDIHLGADGSGPSWLMAVGGKLLFAANDGTHGLQLWKSDGTPLNTTTVQVTDLGVAAVPVWLSPLGAGPLFSAASFPGAEMETNTPAAAAPVKNVKPGDGSNPLWLTAAGNTLFFSADNGTRGRERWKADAPTRGTVRVTRLIPGASGWLCPQAV